MKRVLYIVDDEKSAQFRYRVDNVRKALKGSDKYKVLWVQKEKIFDVDINKIDLLVVLRQTAKNALILEFIKDFQATGKKVLFDLDDLIFDLRDLPILMRSTGSKNIFYWIGYFLGIRRIACLVDGFITTNDFLGKKLSRTFKKPYMAVCNSLNREQIDASGKKLKRNKNENVFWIGYFSGSPTHGRDFRLVEPALISFLERYDNVKMRVVGYMEFSNKMKKMVKIGKVEVLKPVNYLELQELIAKVDVNIAPLVINDFTNCKSELKFFEAAAVETTTIASPTYTFKKAIKDGKNGFLAKPGEWYDKLEYLYKNPEDNKKVAKAAKNYALKHYYGKEFLEEVERAYDFFTK